MPRSTFIVIVVAVVVVVITLSWDLQEGQQRERQTNDRFY